MKNIKYTIFYTVILTMISMFTVIYTINFDFIYMDNTSILIGIAFFSPDAIKKNYCWS
jgi:hypothetical protein